MKEHSEGLAEGIVLHPQSQGNSQPPTILPGGQGWGLAALGLHSCPLQVCSSPANFSSSSPHSPLCSPTVPFPYVYSSCSHFFHALPLVLPCSSSCSFPSIPTPCSSPVPLLLVHSSSLAPPSLPELTLFSSVPDVPPSYCSTYPARALTHWNCAPRNTAMQALDFSFYLFWGYM